MKAERNELCPCGSGKKYKKCCMRKSTETDSLLTISEDTISDFGHIVPTADKVYEKIKKYDFSDLITATFCLNLWRRNRSALAQGLTLHMALSMDKPFGEHRISTFDEFQAFFADVSDLLSVTAMEDYIIDDYGEVFLNHCGQSYPIIIGTGYSQVYGMLRYLQTLSDVCDANDDLGAILEYVRTIIISTEETNMPNDEHVIVYELPTENFWDTIKKLFSNAVFQDQYKTVSKILGDYNGPIERKSFVKRGDFYFPLCNAGILTDYYKLLLSTVSESEKHTHIMKTIHSLLENSFNFGNNPPNRVLIDPVLMSDDLKEKIIEDGLLFATVTKNNLVIGVDRSLFSQPSDLNDVINKIERYLEKGELCLIEPYRRDPVKGHCGLNFHFSKDIVYIAVEPFTDIASHVNWFEDDNQKWFSCTALDLLYFIGFSEGFDEIIDYIKFKPDNKTKTISIGGKSTHFFSWKASHRLIVTGAIEPNLLTLDFNQTEYATYEFFAEKIREFPRTGQGLFIDPLNWKSRGDVLGYNSIHHKGCQGFGGEVKRIYEGIYIFLAHNVEFFTEKDIEHNTLIALKTVDELNQRLFSRYSELLGELEILKNKTLQVLFMPWNYVQENFAGGFISDSSRKIVFSDEYVDQDSVIIRYSIDPSHLLSEIQTATDRSAENLYFKELILPLAKYDFHKFKMLEQKLIEDATLKKTVGIFQIEQHYYFSDKAIDTDISAISFTRVRKQIAKICFDSDIVPGEYRGKDATKVIRKMQTSIVRSFEQELARYDKLDLHYKALNYFAIQQNGIVLNAKRYHAFTDLDEAIQLEFEESTRHIREEYRRNAGTVKYLLESNLSISHVEGGIKCSKEDFNYLLAFADWLVVLQDDADMCHHRDPNFTIFVDADYKVDPILSDEFQARYGDILVRKYNTVDYHIKNDEVDRVFLQQAMEAFKKDTRVDLGVLLSLIEYLQLGIVEDELADEIYPNVFRINRNTLESAFLDLLEDKNYTLADVSKAVEFLILKPQMLKTVEDEIHEILPVWEREKRVQRFTTKPIIMDEENCIFSPVIMNYVLSSWKSGITEWYLPYEIGLDNLTTVLKQWKKRYEDEMVQDIAKAFTEKGTYLVFPEIELAKRFPHEEYPEELGDYDVLAINESKKEIWLIESKVLQKVGSIYEAQMQQKSFFVQNKYDEKFQRRIDFVKQNTNKVLTSLEVAISDYTVIPYMVTNKLFESRYKKIAFPIITLSELFDILKKNNM